MGNVGGSDFVSVAGGGSGGGAACAHVEAAASSSTSTESASADGAQGALDGWQKKKELIPNKKTANSSDAAGEHDEHFTGGNAGGGHVPAGGSPGKYKNGGGCGPVSLPATRA